mgnify:FL=1
MNLRISCMSNLKDIVAALVEEGYTVTVQGAYNPEKRDNDYYIVHIEGGQP